MNPQLKKGVLELCVLSQLTKEDKYGYIWVRSYDHQVYRFNPRTEQFQAIPYEPQIRNRPHKMTQRSKR